MRICSFVVSFAALAGAEGCSSSPPTPGDSSACEPSQEGGNPTAIALEGSFAYVIVGPRLAIWDLSDPGSPKLRGKTSLFDGMLTAVAVSGRYAYITDRTQSAQGSGGQLHVVDVSQVDAPSLVTSMPVSTGQFIELTSVATDGTSLYVADSQSGIAVLDLADPAMPAPAKFLPEIGVEALQVAGRRLYWIAPGSTDPRPLTIGAYDLSASLTDLGTHTFEDDAFRAAVNATNIAVEVGAGGAHVYDLSDLKSPKKLYDNAVLTTRAAGIGASAAWVPTSDGLHVLDLSSPGVVSERARVAAATAGANAVVATGSILAAITAEGRLVSIDVKAPAAPAIKATVDVSLSADASNVVAVGGKLFIADNAGGLRTASEGCLSALGRASPSSPIDFNDVVVADGVAYVADWFYGLRTFDIADPATPMPLGQLATGGYPAAVAFEDGVAYVGESTNAGALRVVDVSDPTRPTLLGTATDSAIDRLRVRNKIVYVADDRGLHIFDATTPSAIQLIGAYEACQWASDVGLDGNTAVLACNDGLHIVDVSNPSAPKRLGLWPHPVSSRASAAIAGARAYMGDDSGVYVIDITHHDSPQMVRQLATASGVRGVIVTPTGSLIAACGLGGIYQWPL